MDRETWMYKSEHASTEYLDGLKYFLKVAEDHRVNEGQSHIWCPCRNCQNCKLFYDLKIIQEHLIISGFMYGYTLWSRHGELLADRNIVDTENNVNNEKDSNANTYDKLEDMLHDIEDDVPDKDYEKFQQLFDEAKKTLVSWLCEIYQTFCHFEIV